MLPVAAYLALASSALAGPALVSTGITVSPSTIYASPDQTPNFSTTFTLREVGGSAITFTHVALAILHADGSHFFDVGLYTNVTVPANGTWTFPVTWRYLTEPGTYKAIARGRFNNGNWFDFGVTGAGVNPVTFTVLPRTAAFGGRVTSQGAGNPGVDGAVVTWGSYNATTSGGGYYSFPSVPCETQTLTVTKSGYYDHSESYTPISLASNQKNVAVMPWGFASVATGVTVTPPTPYASPAPGVNNISVDFSLRETTGFPVTFAEVAAAILDENGTTLFDLPHQANVTVPANGTWTFPTQSGYLVNPGNYRAIVRGHVAGGNWFDFAVTGAGVNPVTFTVLPRTAAFGGRVTSQGAGNPGVDGAVVTWGSYNATTSGGGYYSFPSVPCETQTLTVTKSGYYDHSESYTPICLASNQKNVAVMPWGFASVATGVTVTPPTPYASPAPGVNNISVDFSLRETTGFPVTFAEVAAAILDENGTTLFDLPHQANVTVPANGTWTFPTQSGYLVNPGNYRAIVRGHVAGGNWFDFAVTGAGVNPVTFTVLPRVGFASVETGVAVTPPTPIASSGPGVNNFSVDFTLRETTGAPVTFADVAAAILDEVGTTLFDLPHHTTVSRSANGTWTFPTQSGYLVTPGTYRAIARGRVAGGDWFD